MNNLEWTHYHPFYISAVSSNIATISILDGANLIKNIKNKWSELTRPDPLADDDNTFDTSMLEYMCSEIEDIVCEFFQNVLQCEKQTLIDETNKI